LFGLGAIYDGSSALVGFAWQPTTESQHKLQVLKTKYLDLRWAS